MVIFEELVLFFSMTASFYFSEFSFTLNILVMNYPTLIAPYCDTLSEKCINICSGIFVSLQVTPA